jgi:hypothetical protein
MKFLRAETAASLRCVGCQKVCKQPVAGLAVNGRLEWFTRLDEPKRLTAMAKLVANHGRGELPAALEKSRSRERSGRSPR